MEFRMGQLKYHQSWPSCSSAKEIGLLAPSITEMVVEEPSSSSKNNILHTSLVDTEMVMREPHSATNLGLPSSMDTENVSTPSVIQKEKAQKETIPSDKRTGSILRKCVTKTRRFMNKKQNNKLGTK